MRLSKRIIICLLASFLLLATNPTRAGVGEKVARETAELVIRKFGKTAIREGAETFAERLSKAAVRHGDDLIVAVKKVGPKAIQFADEAGQDAPKILRLLSRHGDDAAEWVIQRPAGMQLLSLYGDDAAEVLIKHKGIAEPLLEKLGKPAVEALGAVGPQNARRLAMMNQSGELAKLGQVSELMAVISKYGDPAMDFIWRNKGPLAVGTTLTAFLSEPKVFIEGTAQLAGIAGTTLVQPVVQETARAFSWLASAVTALLVITLGGSGYLAIRYPRMAASLGKAALQKVVKR